MATSQWKNLGGGIKARVRMGQIKLSADITKAVGDSVQAVASWTPETVDFQGLPIAWPYVAFFDFNDQTAGQQLLLISDNVADPLGDGMTSRANGNVQNFFKSMTIPALPAGTRITVFCSIWAANSDPSGNPLLTREVIDFQFGNNDVIIGTVGGAAVPGASIGSVTVSQHGFGFRRSHLAGYRN